MSQTEHPRAATVAGLFYDSDPAKLTATVDRLLNSASAQSHPGVRGLVSPHAGYVYSGHVAAEGFAAVKNNNIRTVVLIGPTHVEPFHFTSVYTGCGYDTPLGTVRVDQELAHRICDANGIRDSLCGHVFDGADRGEHGLEVQLPFLQRIAPDADIVPVVMGSQSWEACESLAGALKRECAGDDVLILASSDLSHFYDDAKARELDACFAERLRAADARELYEAVALGDCEACGAGPVVAMLLALDSKPDDVSILKAANSSDVSGDTSSVVGYLSAVIASTRGESSDR